MKIKNFLLIFVFLIFSCAEKKDKNPLIIPPNFAEMPDVNNPEKPSIEQQQENVDKLKELLLKND